jgi:hypothetical protein
MNVITLGTKHQKKKTQPLQRPSQLHLQVHLAPALHHHHQLACPPIQQKNPEGLQQNWKYHNTIYKDLYSDYFDLALGFSWII